MAPSSKTHFLRRGVSAQPLVKREYGRRHHLSMEWRWQAHGHSLLSAAGSAHADAGRECRSTSICEGGSIRFQHREADRWLTRGFNEPRRGGRRQIDFSASRREMKSKLSAYRRAAVISAVFTDMPTVMPRLAADLLHHADEPAPPGL